MAKLEKIFDTQGNHSGYIHFCPGCKTYHMFDFRWQFNGDYEKPTFKPSMLINRERSVENAPRCHYFLKSGQIQFLSDCTHEFANKTIPLTEN